MIIELSKEQVSILLRWFDAAKDGSVICVEEEDNALALELALMWEKAEGI